MSINSHASGRRLFSTTWGFKGGSPLTGLLSQTCQFANAAIHRKLKSLAKSKGSSDVKWPITNCRCRWAPQKSGKGVLSHRRHIRKAPNCGDADVIVNIPGKPPVKSTRNGLMMTNYWWLMLYPHRIKVKFSDRFSGSIAICHHSSWLISRWSLFPSTSTRTPVKAKINAASFTQIASATGMSENMVPGPQIHWWIIIFIHLPYKNMAMWSHLGPHFFDSPISWLVKVTFVKACWILCRTDQLSGKNQVLLDELLIATGHCWNTSVSQWNWLLCIPVYPVFTHTHTDLDCLIMPVSIFGSEPMSLQRLAKCRACTKRLSMAPPLPMTTSWAKAQCWYFGRIKL